MRYAIVIEKAENNYSAIEFHLEGMREDGLPIPTPQSRVDYVEVSA
jgi:predicted RNase H-like HicB family nuclease